MNQHNLLLLHSEFIKIRKSPLIYILGALIISFPIIFYFSLNESFFSVKFDRWVEATGLISFKTYFYYQFFVFARLPYSLTICLLVVYIFSLEKGAGSTSPLFSLPVNMFQIFFAKYFILLIFLLITTTGFVITSYYVVEILNSNLSIKESFHLIEYYQIGFYFWFSSSLYIFFCLFLYLLFGKGVYLFFLLSAFLPFVNYMPICPGAFFGSTAFLKNTNLIFFFVKWLSFSVIYIVLSIYLYTIKWKSYLLNL
jgi:ABC-type transport system involved in multi-copper enzyme maturation permease subunit